MERQALLEPHPAAHCQPAGIGPGGEVEALGVGEPIERDEGPARFQRFPDGLLTQFHKQQVGADVAQAVLIRVEAKLEEDVARLPVLRQRRQHGELAGVPLEQLFAERVFEPDLVLVEQADHQADVLMGVVGGDAGVRGLGAELVPASQVVSGVVEQRRECLLRVLAEEIDRLQDPQRIAQCRLQVLLVLEVGVRVVDFDAGQPADVPVHALFQVRQEHEAVAAPHQVGELLRRAGRQAA